MNHEVVSARLERLLLLEREDALLRRIGSARTVGQVWDLTAELERVYRELDAR